MRRLGLAVLLLLAAHHAVAAAAAAATTSGARPDDVPFIQCEVCELLAKQAWRQARDLLKSGTPGNPVHEDRVIELMEKITTSWRPEGEWLARLDLVEQGDRLVVKEMDQPGICGVECKTAERAAERVMGEHDTDVAEALFVGKKNRAQLTNWLCHELSGACATKPSPLPKDREPGPAFEPRPQGHQNVDAMLGGLEEQGLGGAKVRDELKAKLGMAGAGVGGQAEVDAALKAALAGAEAGGVSAVEPEEEQDEYSDEL